MSQGWIAVDLDGTLAHYTEWRGPEHIGEPVKEMVDRVRRWLAEGRDVRIFTARVSGPALDAVKARRAISAWCLRYLDADLPVTCKKDYAMVELWDDRCVQVEPNTGRPIGRSTRGLE